MKNFTLKSVLSSFSFLLCAQFAHATDFGNVSICDDNGEWPPYLYYELKDGKKTDQLVGYSKDLVDKIAKKNNFTYKIDLLPWQRCLDNVKNNKGNEALLEFSITPQRKEDYLLTEPLYFTNSAIFYHTKFHKKIEVAKLEDLKKYKVCGLFGYNYKTYGFNESEVDQGAKTIDGVAKKIEAGRCDFFIEKLEVVAGFGKSGGLNLLNPKNGFSYTVLNFVEKTPFVMGVSKKYPKAKEFVEVINKDLKEYEKDGTLKALEKKWIN